MTHDPVDSRLDELAARYFLPAAAPRQLRSILNALAAEHSSVSTVRDPQEAVERHVEDSLAGLLAPELASAGSIADLGAGGGFPGLVLAVALPDVRVTLVESVSRKCAFLEHAALNAGLKNVEVVCTRAEEIADRRFDAVTARALAPLPVLAEYAAPLLELGGHAVLWKGSPAAAEFAAGERAAELLGLTSAAPPILPAPESGHPRRLVIYRKVADTPSGFPRRVGVARKRPLGG